MCTEIVHVFFMSFFALLKTCMIILLFVYENTSLSIMFNVRKFTGNIKVI